MERDALDLGSLRVGTLFRKLFVPTLLGMVSMSAVAVVDGIFVGHGVGSDGIAAVNICIPLLMIFTGIGLMAGVGSSVVSSIHFARGQVKAARINVTQALLFVTLVTLLPVTVILAFPRLTALLLGSSEHLLPLVVDYLIWFVPGLIPQLWIAVGLFVVRLDGAPRLAMWCSVLSALVNVLLDWLFIFPLGWGVMGAAFASTISIATGGVIVVRYLTHGARTLRLYRLKWSRKSFRLTFRNIGYQCRIGSSALLGEMTMAVLLFTGNQVFMRYLGDAGVGAFGITCYYMPFIFMIGNAVAQSAQPIISYSFVCRSGGLCGTDCHRRIPAFCPGVYLLCGQPGCDWLFPKSRASCSGHALCPVARIGAARAVFRLFAAAARGLGYLVCHAALGVSDFPVDCRIRCHETSEVCRAVIFGIPQKRTAPPSGGGSFHFCLDHSCR